jgi:1-phosphatidylinositol-4-phosphate 5-kinase
VKVRSTYKGEFKEGSRCGDGIEETNHGIYTGEWKDDRRHGEGEMIYKNGDSYKGHWEHNEFSGQGCYRETGNCIYTG